MSDPTLFVAGALFTQDYLQDGIRNSAAYAEVDTAAIRNALEKIAAGLPRDSAPNEATTELDFIWPVLEALGWSDYLTQQNLSGKGRVDVPDGLLFIDAEAKAKANKFDEVERFGHGAAVVESKRWGRPLDRAEGKSGTAKDTPSTQLLRYLRRIDDLTTGNLRWGILTNGAKWRLYFAGARSVIDDYLELDLSRILRLDDDLLDTGVTEAERDHWLAVFAAMFSRIAFERDSASGRSFHDRARTDAALYEERVAASLSNLVFEQLYPELGKAVAAAAPAATPLEDVRQATLILLYRLLFVLYAEDRGLLPVRDKRFDDYALRPKRLEVQRRKNDGDVFSDTAPALWSHLTTLTTIIDKGDKTLGVPPYNGGLFSEAQTPLLANIRLGDAVMADALDILSFEQRDGERRYINYRDLSVQQLGSIYERLLEFELTRDDEGAVDIRPNIFARKNSGSYYTPDDLVLLILDETLEPLIGDAMAAFKTALAERETNRPADQQIYRLQKHDPAAAITRLRICDPAMGSGHFLVSLVDRLTNHALTAVAEAAQLASDAGLDEYESPVAENIRQIRATIQHNADEEGWAVTEEQLDDPQLVKRMVLKRCVYGADKNPMAVELAKVSLWLHTFTVGAPLSFIDHHLAAGDSLFGLWVRDAMDKAGEGGGLFLHEPLANAQRQAAAMQNIEALTDAEIAEAHKSAEMWRDVEAQTGPLDGFVSFIHALDWLAAGKKGPALQEHKKLRNLWLDGRFGEPIPIARGKAQPDDGKAKPEEVEAFTAIWQKARELIDEERFLNWQITFPGVWTNWASAAREGGFDAVVGNPPWDRIKLQQVEWFAARRPEIAKAQRASDRKKMIAALKANDDPLFDDYQKADKRAADTLKMARQKPKEGGQYPLLSRGDINLYSLFVERAHSLVKPNGMVGLLTPSGIASDLSASEFFRKVATGGNIKSLYDFENRRTRYGLEPFFPDVDSRFKFAALVASPSRTFDAAQCGFFMQAIGETKNPEQCFPITATDFANVNPNTGTAPIFRTRRDMELTTAIYARVPALVDRSSGEEVRSWPVKYVTMFHMANDSDKFRTQTELEEQEGAWGANLGKWQSQAGDWLPLFEGKLVQGFDHRASDITINTENLSRPGQQSPLTESDHSNPARLGKPRYWVQKSEIEPCSQWAVAFKDITASTNVRSVISALIPSCAAGHTLPLLLPVKSGEFSPALASQILSNLNSIVFDYVARQKIQTNHLAWYTLEQLPVIPMENYGHSFGPKTAADIVKEAVLELTYTAHDMAPFAKDVGHVDEAGEVLRPFIWDEERRLHLRAKLDALYFILYGVFDPADPAQSRDDIRYIYSTFPIVERQEKAAYNGQYRSRDLCLAYINALMAGQPDAVVEGQS
ncbi:restriction endonuclease [Altererythrobacter sp. RZ02]|uniref:site-specific DNA-methyltransferase (adenine-specific) n=1 Tax=Pontixanthobacter rizhaonensis TaxID=2730337 RepID=A0A848QHC7_9SPHN|nr:restriction endonuclease [Pontixanthobacter rizhaonensis]NMW32042.1 restriction endonuclease [Pontixanthobacter rizhaonensis]